MKKGDILFLSCSKIFYSKNDKEIIKITVEKNMPMILLDEPMKHKERIFIMCLFDGKIVSNTIYYDEILKIENEK